MPMRCRPSPAHHYHHRHLTDPHPTLTHFQSLQSAALYLARRDFVRGGFKLIPGVALPSADGEWMAARLATVRQERRECVCVCVCVCRGRRLLDLT